MHDHDPLMEIRHQIALELFGVLRSNAEHIRAGQTWGSFKVRTKSGLFMVNIAMTQLETAGNPPCVQVISLSPWQSLSPGQSELRSDFTIPLADPGYVDKLVDFFKRADS